MNLGAPLKSLYIAYFQNSVAHGGFRVQSLSINYGLLT